MNGAYRTRSCSVCRNNAMIGPYRWDLRLDKHRICESRFIAQRTETHLLPLLALDCPESPERRNA